MTFSIGAIVFLFGIFNFCRAEKCICTNYLIGEGGLSSENEIVSVDFELEETLCDGNGVSKCKDFCLQMFQEMTEHGNICSIIPDPDTEKTTGQWICDYLKRDVCNIRAGVFSKACGSNFVDTDFRYKQSICCEDGKFKGC